jgi:3-dehydroquinate synthase
LRRIEVEVGGRAYEVVVGAGILEAADRLLPDLEPAGKAFVVADHRVASLYLEVVVSALERRRLQTMHLPVAEGEAAKSVAVAEATYRQLAFQAAHRDDVIVSLGGGSAGDLAGFVAGTYMRGVPLVHLPTTLTAQVDAAIGGKTGVNLPEGKNLVGVFHQPRAVLADVATLATLPDRDFRAGLAEVAKVGLAVDPSVAETLEGKLEGVLGRDPAVLEDLVAGCVRAKARVVASDERDEGPRLVLNYGHTVGHALERLDEFAGRTHGEAVAVGMIFAARLSEAAGIAANGLVGRHLRLLASLGIGASGPLPPAASVVDALRLDKKHRSTTRFVLLEDVGRPRIVSDVPDDVVIGVLREMGAPA